MSVEKRTNRDGTRSLPVARRPHVRDGAAQTSRRGRCAEGSRRSSRPFSRIRRLDRQAMDAEARSRGRGLTYPLSTLAPPPRRQAR